MRRKQNRGKRLPLQVTFDTVHGVSSDDDLSLHPGETEAEGCDDFFPVTLSNFNSGISDTVVSSENEVTQPHSPDDVRDYSNGGSGGVAPADTSPRRGVKRVSDNAAAGSELQLMAKRMKALEERLADVTRSRSGETRQGTGASGQGMYESFDYEVDPSFNPTDPLGLQSVQTPDREVLNDFDDMYSDILPSVQPQNDDIFAIPDDIFGDTKYGPNVHEGLAKLVNRACRKSSDVSKMSEKYPVPANCTDMTIPRCNPEIWGKLGKPSQSRDFQLKEVQKAIADGMVPVMRLTESLMNHPDFRDKFRPLSIDALSILGNAVHQLTVKRRYLMRPALPPSYHALCSKEMPISSNLFGDDLPKKVREISEANKAFSVLSSRRQVQRGAWNSGHGQRGRGGYRGSSRPFLRQGNRGRPYRRPASTQQGQGQTQSQKKE